MTELAAQSNSKGVLCMSLEEKYRIPVEKLRWSYLHTGELNFCESSRDVPPLQGIIVRIGPLNRWTSGWE